MGRTHIAAGLCVAGYAANEVHPTIVIPAVGIALFGSLLPDIDHGSSTLGSKVAPISWFLSHRGITHTLLFAIVVSAAVGFYLQQIYGYQRGLELGLVGFAGILSHLILDIIASRPGRGIPLFYIPILNAKPGRIGMPIVSIFLSTNSILERFVFRYIIGAIGAALLINAFTGTIQF